MRLSALILALMLVFGYNACGGAKPARTLSTISAPRSAPTVSNSALPTKVDFATEVRPILESRCTPCHFAGGAMYQRLPFNRPETIKTLGTKLFTRLKDENEQRLIRQFLSQ
jgi:hypothetical protein